MPIPTGWELIVLLGVLVLLFGATKLPTAARSIGQSMRIFKAEARGLRSDNDDDEPDAPPQASPAPNAQRPQSPQQALPPMASPAVAPVEEAQRHRDTSR